MAVDDQSKISFSISRGTLTWQSNFVGLVHECRWTQAASGAAGRANVGFCLVSRLSIFCCDYVRQAKLLLHVACFVHFRAICRVILDTVDNGGCRWVAGAK